MELKVRTGSFSCISLFLFGLSQLDRKRIYPLKSWQKSALIVIVNTLLVQIKLELIRTPFPLDKNNKINWIGALK